MQHKIYMQNKANKGNNLLRYVIKKILEQKSESKNCIQLNVLLITIVYLLSLSDIYTIGVFLYVLAESGRITNTRRNKMIL